ALLVDQLDAVDAALDLVDVGQVIDEPAPDGDAARGIRAHTEGRQRDELLLHLAGLTGRRLDRRRGGLLSRGGRLRSRARRRKRDQRGTEPKHHSLRETSRDRGHGYLLTVVVECRGPDGYAAAPDDAAAGAPARRYFAAGWLASSPAW